MGVNNTVLSRLFTQYAFNDLVEKNHSTIYSNVVRRYKIDPSGKTNQQVISEIYRVLSKSYRNEYFYQNTLLNKLLLGIHNLNTTTALTQIPIGKSKADFIMINGKAVVYEIKSELDSFERLETQLHDYYRAFNHVCVITSENNYEKIRKLLYNGPVGFYVLTKKDTLSKKMRKEPAENNSYLEHSAIFKLLHKSEFENILYAFWGRLPECQPVFYYDECFTLFSTIPIEIAYQMALKELKKRNEVVIEQFAKVPYELKSLIYFSSTSVKDYTMLNSFLQNEFGG
ncbi:sce7726 family protein [Pelotomaculum terephthalicicum JT]|uniref:sce7726 family protein n=1 Tax=Pelotomaculum TaxID=191373 RepID=UPI0009CE9BCC|nr:MULTISPECIES: sce7726 family protein [Pelotomaculum]MCG9967440.1 sce7726 family protein [Pelotomaculum terephthalicicum JT]OPX87725.1 MAG: hypothetical protein A4E54_01531 [Pelotomaculum sp. PtaB.Bin117]OPY61626.1 MAG: hypothetical protein A4E56_01927 [Pelotomaculum sp. PtaU1.Bin065]